MLSFIFREFGLQLHALVFRKNFPMQNKQQRGSNRPMQSYLRWQKWQRRLTISCVSLAIFLFLFGLSLLSQSQLFTQLFSFKTIRVEGQLDHTNVPALQAQIRKHLSGGFFSQDMAELEDQVRQNPWVARVALRRIWPATLAIYIQEKQPILRWGTKRLILADGSVFEPPDRRGFSSLPLLEGAPEYIDVLFENYQHFAAALLPFDLRINTLQVDSSGAWSISLNQHWQIFLGKIDVDAAFYRFTKLYSSILRNNPHDALRIDLRYPSGAAVERLISTKKIV